MWSMPEEILNARLLQTTQVIGVWPSLRCENRKVFVCTHSQNSMTEEVVFGFIVWLMDEFLLRNSTQFSRMSKVESQKQKQT